MRKVWQKVSQYRLQIQRHLVYLVSREAKRSDQLPTNRGVKELACVTSSKFATHPPNPFSAETDSAAEIDGPAHD
mgnify:CR=1 FL=1